MQKMVRELFIDEQVARSENANQLGNRMLQSRATEDAEEFTCLTAVRYNLEVI